MFVVDTNILLYAVDQDSPHHERCRRLLDAWRRQSVPWYLTWGILYEFIRVATHRNVFRRPMTSSGAWAVVAALLASPSVNVLVETDRHERLAREVFSEHDDLTGNAVFDAHTAILMREHGLRTIYTRDTDFHRFSFLEVVDPVRSPG